MEPSRLLPERTLKYSELMYGGEGGEGGEGRWGCDGYEIPRPASRQSRRSLGAERPSPRRPPRLLRTHSLRAGYVRPANATIVPLRSGISKRASLCEGVDGAILVDPSTSTGTIASERFDGSERQSFKTPF